MAENYAVTHHSTQSTRVKLVDEPLSHFYVPIVPPIVGQVLGVLLPGGVVGRALSHVLVKFTAVDRFCSFVYHETFGLIVFFRNWTASYEKTAFKI